MTYLENERAQVLLVYLETFEMVRFSKRKVEYKYCHHRNARPISEQVTLLVIVLNSIRRPYYTIKSPYI
jgi:hypothetical protein